jgi:hypothetical protein
MIQIDLEKDGAQGTIIFDPKDPANFQVQFPDSQTVKAIQDYLTTPQTYQIPESQRIDDF